MTKALRGIIPSSMGLILVSACYDSFAQLGLIILVEGPDYFAEVSPLPAGLIAPWHGSALSSTVFPVLLGD